MLALGLVTWPPLGKRRQLKWTTSRGWGLVAWERTLGDLLSGAGYACAAYGKWHVGEGPGRWPTDKGFQEWYGPPRTYDEALWPDDRWYDPANTVTWTDISTGGVAHNYWITSVDKSYLESPFVAAVPTP